MNGYNAWSVTAFEVPTTAKWNILGDNDAYLYDTLINARRPKIQATLNLYVRTNGNDSNDGTADDALHAFLTLQHAWDVASGYDTSIYPIVIHIADGTYNSGITISSAPVGGSLILITGNTTTPANVIINTTGVACFDISAVCNIKIEGVKLTTNYIGIYSHGDTRIILGAIEFGACSSAHIWLDRGSIFSITNYTISGNSPFHITQNGPSFISFASLTCTLSGTIAFTTFCSTTQNAVAQIYNTTYTGSATGKRYDANSCGVIQTYGAGSTKLPGNASGTTATGGQYL